MSVIVLVREIFREQVTWRPNRTQALRFALSLLLAIMLWGWVTQREDPFQTEVYPELQITQSLPSSLQIVSEIPPAEVRVRGPESELRNTNRANVNLSLDTRSITGPGTYTVAVRATVPGVQDVNVEPAELLVTVEERVNRVFALTVEQDAGDDQSRTIGRVSPEVSQVNVVGPASAVNRVAKVSLPVSLQQQVTDFQTLLNPVAYDAATVPITEVEITPSSIVTRIEVRTTGKPVSVVANIVGEPAEGFTIQQRRALPETILVDGPPEVLQDLLFVNTEPVDVTGRTESFSVSVNLEDLPNGVTVVDATGPTVEVRVAIVSASQSTQTLQSIPVQLIGVEDGLEARVTTPNVTLQVSAPVGLLQSMSAQDVNVLIDTTGLGPGTYSLSPEVTLPQGATWISNDPAEVTVIITDVNATPSAAGGTPGASVPSTPSTSPSSLTGARELRYRALR